MVTLLNILLSPFICIFGLFCRVNCEMSTSSISGVILRQDWKKCPIQCWRQSCPQRSRQGPGFHLNMSIAIYRSTQNWALCHFPPFTPFLDWSESPVMVCALPRMNIRLITHLKLEDHPTETTVPRHVLGTSAKAIEHHISKWGFLAVQNVPSGSFRGSLLLGAMFYVKCSQVSSFG